MYISEAFPNPYPVLRPAQTVKSSAEPVDAIHTFLATMLIYPGLILIRCFPLWSKFQFSISSSKLHGNVEVGALSWRASKELSMVPKIAT